MGVIDRARHVDLHCAWVEEVLVGRGELLSTGRESKREQSVMKADLVPVLQDLDDRRKVLETAGPSL